MFADFSADVRYSLRSLARAPVWTAALVLTIALGIGGSASVQGFMRGLLTTDLPIFAIRRVVTVVATDTAGASGPVPFDAFTTLRNRTDVFESLGAIRESQQRVAIGTRSTLLSVAAYTRDVGAVLPLPVQQGAALSHRLRYAQFPATANPEGTPIEIGGARTTISGAMPYWLEGLYRGRAIDLWVPFGDTADEGGHDTRVWLLGRLRPGMSVEAAQAAIDSSISTGDAAITVFPYTGQTPETASGMFRVGVLLQLAATAVFLISCANVAAFMLARSWARARETAVRVAIGARRRQLLRQLLIDSAVISLIGGAAGFILAKWMADIVPLMFFVQDADRLVFAPDAPGIIMTALWCLLITMTCGLAPLFETRDEEPSAVLQREMAGPSKAMTRVNTGLMLLQMAGCTLLVISTGLLLDGFRAALNTKAGRDLGNPALLTLEALPSPSPVEGRKYFADAIVAAHAATRISETVWAARLPGSRPAWQWVRFDPPQRERRHVSMPIEPLREPLLDRLLLPPVSGRLFGALPPRADAGECGTLVLNEAAANTLFDGHAIGRVLDTTDGRPVEVIGVVRPKDARDKVAAAYDHPAATAPLGRDGQITLLAPPAAELESGTIDINIVSSNYFDAMGLTLQDGELFEARGRGCRIGVVNEEAADRYFGGRAVGGAVIDANGQRTGIVGVVRSTLLRSAQRLIEPTLFLPMTQDYLPRMTAVLVTPSAGAGTVAALRTQVAAVPGGRADRLVVTSLDEHLSNTTLAPERIAATLVGTFAAIAIALAIVGLYGLMTDAARRRQREFATRLALGAQRWRVVRLVMGEGMRLVMIGAAIGMSASLLVGRWMNTIAPSATSPSPVLWVAPVALLAGAVAIASVIPARRALSVDLVSLMRDL